MKLFCKPARSKHASQYLYEQDGLEFPGLIHFRSLQHCDIALIHDWVNQPYTKKYWGLDGTLEQVNATYDKILQSPHAHSYIGLFNHRIVCQVDLYLVAADELKDHVSYGPDDCGLHFLMAPPRQIRRGLSRNMLKAFVNYYFSFPMADRLYAEPDRENLPANLLAQKAGFDFQKNIALSGKNATLYCITREKFLST